MKEKIETKRCNLVSISDRDHGDIFRLYQNEKVRKFLGGTITDENSFNKRFSEIIHAHDAWHWIVRLKDNKNFIGLISIDQHHDGQDYEISYQFLPDYWGKGFAEETILSVFSYATHTLKLDKLVSETQKANLASCKLLEKLNMKPLKTLTRFGAEQIIYSKSFL